VFADVDEATFNIDPKSLERAIAKAKRLGLKPRAVIPVDLFGLPAEHAAIATIAAAEDIFILDDAAQSFGATYHGRPLGTFGLATATSFFPAKPLGCYGDGGAIFTDDDELAALLVSLRVHGQSTTDKYDNVRVGLTGRLDTMQAAVLLEKLKIFPDEIAARNKAAERYGNALGNVAAVPRTPDGHTSVWAQYTIRVEPARRNELAAALKADGIPTAIYYPKPLHRQEAYGHFPYADGGLPISDRLAHEVISLPMHAYLDEPTQDRIIDAVHRALSR
jgi:dTDP-4-amino-4,6-dideoxygalactose transaminase